MPKVIRFVISTLLIPKLALAQCGFVNYQQVYSDNPYFVKVKIEETSMNYDKAVKECIDNQDENNKNCNYKFTATIKHVLKGEINNKKLFFEYPLFRNMRCGWFRIFTLGSEVILPVKFIGSDGKSEFNERVSIGCGWWNDSDWNNKIIETINKNRVSD